MKSLHFKEKLKEKFSKKRFLTVLTTSSLTTLALSIATFAADDSGGSSSSSGSDISGFITQITDALGEYINLSTLGTVLIAGLAIALPLFIAWFVFRRIKSAASSGLKKGKM